MTRILTVLGGGSAYAPGLVQALIHHRGQLGIEELRLHDIDQARLEIVAKLAARMCEASGAPFRVKAEADLDQALSNCTVVLNSTRPGGLGARHLDETLPLEFDIPGQETVGPGGFFFALRSVPYTLKVAERLSVLSPDAVLLNYTNPTNIVSQALARRTDLRCLGLCDQSDEDLETLAHAMRSPPIASFECVGLNHATWYSSLTHGDGSRFVLEPKVSAPSELDEEHALRFQLSIELWNEDATGWPNSYLPYYTHPAAFVALAKRRGSRAHIIEASLPAYYAHFEEETSREVPQLRRHRGTTGFGDLAVRTLMALFVSEPRKLVLNVQNRGATSSFASDTVVEMPIRLGARSLDRGPVPPLPEFLAPLLSRLENYQRASAEIAAARSSPGVWAEALAENPLVPDGQTARALVERAREAYPEGVLEGLA